MGGSISKLFSGVSGKKEAKVLLLGLDGAGKTTMLHKLGCRPTIFVRSVESVSYKDLDLISWDIGGYDKLLPLFRRFYPGTKGVILVVDSADRKRLGEVRDSLQKLLLEELLRDACLLVFANKQGVPDAMCAAEMIDRLDLESIDRRKWHIQGSCGTTGEGLYEGLDWMNEACKEQKS
eukprot:Hpha_TRINITY_DN15593_c2_g2::TRINITY_DN15593_c2_g2_i1::g.104808::m.104808/K07937/ARF1; ADP-ribosylation factor 1